MGDGQVGFRADEPCIREEKSACALVEGVVLGEESRIRCPEFMTEEILR